MFWKEKNSSCIRGNTVPRLRITTGFKLACSIEEIIVTFDFCHCSREDSTEKRVQRARLNDEIDQKFGYERYKDPQEKVGWLINMHPVCK